MAGRGPALTEPVAPVHRHEPHAIARAHRAIGARRVEQDHGGASESAQPPGDRGDKCRSANRRLPPTPRARAAAASRGAGRRWHGHRSQIREPGHEPQHERVIRRRRRARGRRRASPCPSMRPPRRGRARRSPPYTTGISIVRPGATRGPAVRAAFDAAINALAVDRAADRSPRPPTAGGAHVAHAGHPRAVAPPPRKRTRVHRRRPPRARARRAASSRPRRASAERSRR